MSPRKWVFLIILVASMCSFAIFWLAQVIGSNDEKERLTRPSIAENCDSKTDSKIYEGGHGWDCNKPLTKVTNHESAQNHDKPSLAALKKEMETLGYDEIIDELFRLKSRIYETDLIERLNREQLSIREQDDAKEIFDRITVLGIEKVERKLANMAVDLEKVVTQREKRLEEIRAVLSN